MNTLDIIILIPVILFVFRGFRKGLIIELATLAALFLGIFLGIYFSDFVAELLVKYLGLNANYTSAVAFLVIFVAVIILVRMLAKAIEKLIKMVALGFFNRILGALLGLLKALLLMSLIFYLIVRFDPMEKLLTKNTKEKSLLFKPVSAIAPLTIPQISKGYSAVKEMDTIMVKKPDASNNNPKK